MANASPREIKEAFEQLSDLQMAKLRKYCSYRVKSLGRNAYNHKTDDIMQEVFMRIFSTRSWKKDEVDFFYHLKMTISSVVDEYKKKNERQKSHAVVITESDVGTSESNFSVENTPSNTAGETDEEAKQEVINIISYFDDSPALKDILLLKMEGHTGSEIAKKLNLKESEYKSKDRMLRRKIIQYQARSEYE